MVVILQNKLKNENWFLKSHPDRKVQRFCADCKTLDGRKNHSLD